MAHGQDDPAPAPDETHVSPDATLTMLVWYGDEPSLGFAGFSWHVHGAREEIADLAAKIRADLIKLDIRSRGGVREDISLVPVDDHEYAERARKYLTPGEQLEIRTWSGR